MVEAAADGGELEPVADVVAEVGGGGGEAKGAILAAGGVDGGERLDGCDDRGDHAFGGGEGEGFVGEVVGACVVTVGGGEDRFGVGARRSTGEVEAEDTRTRLVEDGTGGVERRRTTVRPSPRRGIW